MPNCFYSLLLLSSLSNISRVFLISKNTQATSSSDMTSVFFTCTHFDINEVHEMSENTPKNQPGVDPERLLVNSLTSQGGSSSLNLLTSDRPVLINDRAGENEKVISQYMFVATHRVLFTLCAWTRLELCTQAGSIHRYLEGQLQLKLSMCISTHRTLYW